jgi:hypothetical protein
MIRIGRLIPWTIALACALDLATRLVPIDVFSFRAWETLVVGRGPTGPFEPNRVYVNPLTYGDLARPQRYRHLRQPHLEYFSTDAWGFRITTSPSAAAPVRWLLIGDSFGVSSGVRDGGTLASALAAASGEAIYNASSYDPLGLGDIRFTVGRLGMTRGLVVFEYMERQEFPAPPFQATRVFTDGPPRPAHTIAERYRVLKKDAAVSRLTILAGWTWDAIDAKIAAPSADGAAAAAAELPTSSYRMANGATMLFYTGDVEATLRPNRVIPTDYQVWLQSQLAPMNLQLAVLIAPTKYQVYGPLVSDRAAPPPSPAPLDRFAADLNARGVFAVNVTDALKKEAAAALLRNDYLYFVDDTHWNERGIAVAARTFVDRWKARDPV